MDTHFEAVSFGTPVAELLRATSLSPQGHAIEDSEPRLGFRITYESLMGMDNSPAEVYFGLYDPATERFIGEELLLTQNETGCLYNKDNLNDLLILGRVYRMGYLKEKGGRDTSEIARKWIGSVSCGIDDLVDTPKKKLQLYTGPIMEPGSLVDDILSFKVETFEATAEDTSSNDTSEIHVELVSGLFEKAYFGKKKRELNVEVTVRLCDEDGVVVPKSVRRGGSLSVFKDEYRSCAFYHNPTPTYQEVVSVKLPSLSNLHRYHIYFEMCHVSSTEGCSIPFSLARLPLLDANTKKFIPDKEYNLDCYLCDRLPTPRTDTPSCDLPPSSKRNRRSSRAAVQNRLVSPTGRDRSFSPFKSIKRGISMSVYSKDDNAALQDALSLPYNPKSPYNEITYNSVGNDKATGGFLTVVSCLESKCISRNSLLNKIMLWKNLDVSELLNTIKLIRKSSNSSHIDQCAPLVLHYFLELIGSNSVSDTLSAAAFSTLKSILFKLSPTRLGLQDLICKHIVPGLSTRLLPFIIESITKESYSVVHRLEVIGSLHPLLSIVATSYEISGGANENFPDQLNGFLQSLRAILGSNGLFDGTEASNTRLHTATLGILWVLYDMREVFDGEDLFDFFEQFFLQSSGNETKAFDVGKLLTYIKLFSHPLSEVPEFMEHLLSRLIEDLHGQILDGIHEETELAILVLHQAMIYSRTHETPTVDIGVLISQYSFEIIEVCFRNLDLKSIIAPTARSPSNPSVLSASSSESEFGASFTKNPVAFIGSDLLYEVLDSEELLDGFLLVLIELLLSADQDSIHSLLCHGEDLNDSDSHWPITGITASRRSSREISSLHETSQGSVVAAGSSQLMNASIHGIYPRKPASSYSSCVLNTLDILNHIVISTGLGCATSSSRYLEIEAGVHFLELVSLDGVLSTLVGVHDLDLAWDRILTLALNLLFSPDLALDEVVHSLQMDSEIDPRLRVCRISNSLLDALLESGLSYLLLDMFTPDRIFDILFQYSVLPFFGELLQIMSRLILYCTQVENSTPTNSRVIEGKLIDMISAFRDTVTPTTHTSQFETLFFREVSIRGVKIAQCTFPDETSLASRFETLMEDVENHGKSLGTDLSNIQENVAIEATVTLLNSFQEQNRIDLYDRLLLRLADCHERLGNHMEAAMALLKFSGEYTSLDDFTATLPAILKLPRSTRYDRYIYTMEMAISHLKKANSWEQVSAVYRQLSDVAESIVGDYAYSSNCLKLQLSAQSNALDGMSCYPEYYRVALYGSGFDVYERGAHYIFKATYLESVIDFPNRIRSYYPEAKVEVSKASVPSKYESTEYTGQYIQICKVEGSSTKPNALLIFENPMDGRPFHFKQYRKNTGVRYFTYSRAMVGSLPVGAVELSAKNEFSHLWTEKVTMETSESFPNITRRLNVSGTTVCRMSPLEKAVESILRKTDDIWTIIRLVEASKDKNISRLTMVLNGVIDAAVMGGIAKYEEAFFQSNYLEAFPDDIPVAEKFHLAFHNQHSALRYGMELFQVHCSPDLRPLYDHLSTMFNKLNVK